VPAAAVDGVTTNATVIGRVQYAAALVDAVDVKLTLTV
jgi:hypothetical protein